jgi:hypothetical protein
MGGGREQGGEMTQCMHVIKNQKKKKEKEMCVVKDYRLERKVSKISKML